GATISSPLSRSSSTKRDDPSHRVLPKDDVPRRAWTKALLAFKIEFGDRPPGRKLTPTHSTTLNHYFRLSQQPPLTLAQLHSYNAKHLHDYPFLVACSHPATV